MALPAVPLYVVQDQRLWRLQQLLQPRAVAGAPLIQHPSSRGSDGKCEAGEPAAEAFLR
jgi:hypothetical protein